MSNAKLVFECIFKIVLNCAQFCVILGINAFFLKEKGRKAKLCSKTCKVVFNSVLFHSKPTQNQLEFPSSKPD